MGTRRTTSCVCLPPCTASHPRVLPRIQRGEQDCGGCGGGTSGSGVAEQARAVHGKRGGALGPKGVAAHAPGIQGLGGGLVAIHMVYSKAHKRQEAMEVMGWWRSHLRKNPPPENPAAQLECPLAQNSDPEVRRSPAARGILFSHTYFRQMESGQRSFICGARAKEGGCPCCVAVPDPAEKAMHGIHLAHNTPDDHVHEVDPGTNKHVVDVAPGCGMSVDGGWNEFWD